MKIHKSRFPRIVSHSSADEEESCASEDHGDHSTNANTDRTRTSLRRNSDASKCQSRTFVEHHYHDHSRDPLRQAIELPGPRADNGVMSRTFPEKLHELLKKIEEEGLEHIISWQPHGRCFAIHKKDQFVNEIMPRFFMQTKLTSFQRQLNLYGFIRLTTGRDRGGYYHEYFFRGRPDLCHFMVRTRVKGIGMKAASSPGTEPDFYKFPPCPSDGSHKVEDNNTKFTSTNPSAEDSADKLMPSLVSPPGSPVLSSSIVDALNVMPPSYLLESNPLENTLPHTGDEVEFEGLSFHYLDHLDLDDVHDMMAVTNIEYL